MKRVIVILFCAVCGWVSVLAQDHYRIYSHTGKVEYKLALSDIPWQQVQDGMELSIIDSVRIPEGGKVRILHVEPNMLYKPIESGTKDVYHWIKAAQNANSNHIRGTILVDVFSGQKKQIDVHDMRVLGASVRGTQSRDTLEQMADMFVWIGAQACSGKPSPKVEGITFKKNKVFGEWDFVYENHTSKNYFINVLHINKLTDNVSLCYVLTPSSKKEETTVCPIVPSGYCQCGMDLFFPASENDVYVLVATEIPYNTDDMDIELSRHSIKTAKKSDLDIKYMW